MSQEIHLLIPMSGQGTRYAKAGYLQPKPLIPVGGVPMIERLLASFPERWPAHFVLAENHRDSGLPELLRRLRPSGRLTYVAPHALGPGHAIRAALEGIPADARVLVSYCDYGLVWDAAAFERFVTDSECDACLPCYRGFHAHYLGDQPYAYCRLDGERVVEIREKGWFTADRETEYASAGAYYFRSATALREAIDHQVARGLSVGGEYYTSLTTEALLRLRPEAQVRVFELPAFFQWGTPQDLRTFEYWERTFRALNRGIGRRGQVAQVLMPMAGLGSRLASITRAPKPLARVFGRPMFRAALDTLPAARRTVVVTLDHLGEGIAGGGPGEEHVLLRETPPGQALSTEAGLPRIDPGQEVLVSACDHGIAVAPERWRAFHEAPECDAAIFTVDRFPGAARRPLAYSYVVPVPGTGPFPIVERVSVKRNTREDPLDDNVLVGTFWFASGALLAEGIAALKARDLRVNGELYLDSVFDVLAARGRRIRMVPLDGYVNWGDADSLAEALYWQEVFFGRRIERRPRFPGVAGDGNAAGA